jgi:4-diphosphocytidyl-2-C-methyl-D-erythritol kinase
VTRRILAAHWAEARAKVNLGLAVTGRRADGFHTLDSVFLRVRLHDHLEARAVTPTGSGDEIVVVGDTGVSTGDDLVLRAAAALREATAEDLPGLRFRLEKDIPVAAGLGGGSADAAAALGLAAEAWGLAADDPRIGAAAVRLGADVPFCLSRAHAARVSGIGEVVVALPTPTPPAGILLVTPPGRLSTAAVFARLDGLATAVGAATADETAADTGPTAAAAAVEALAATLAGGATGADVAALAPSLRDANDLCPAAHALLPALAPLRDGLEVALGRPFLLTGSGPTLLAIYPSPQDASRAAGQLDAAALPVARGARIIATSSSAAGGTS